MLLELIQVVNSNAVLINLASFLLGLWLGHRFNIYTARRHERIVAFKPIRQWIATELQTPGAAKKPDNFELYEAYYRLSWFRRRRFARALKQYEDEHKKKNPDQATMKAALKVCFRRLHSF